MLMINMTNLVKRESDLYVPFFCCFRFHHSFDYSSLQIQNFVSPSSPSLRALEDATLTCLNASALLYNNLMKITQWEPVPHESFLYDESGGAESLFTSGAKFKFKDISKVRVDTCSSSTIKVDRCIVRQPSQGMLYR